MMLVNGSSESGATRKFPCCHLQETKFVIMNNSSIEKNDVISTDEDLEKLPEVNPKNVSLHKISNFSKAWYHIGFIDDNFDFEFSPENLFNSSHLLDNIYTLPSSKNQMINLHYCK